MSLDRRHGFGLGPARSCALAGCLLLFGSACAEESPTPVEVTREAVSEQPAWKPPPPPPRPKTCGVGCLEGRGNATVRFQMAGGDHSASVTVAENEGLFAIGPPINISENATNWSGITTFFNSEAGVYPIRIRATGKWTLTVVKGKQSYAE